MGIENNKSIDKTDREISKVNTKEASLYEPTDRINHIYDN